MQFTKRINVLLSILICLELVAYGYSIHLCGVFGYVFFTFFFSFFAAINYSLAIMVEKEKKNILQTVLFDILKKSRQTFFCLVLVVWAQGWAWANWTWRSLLVAAIAYLIIQHLFTNAIRNEKDRR